MKVKGIELMQMIVEGKIKEGFEIQCTDWKGIYIFQKEEFVSEKIGASIFHRYSLQDFLNTYFEILEDKTEEIEEIKTKGIFDYGELLGLYELKINELVRAYNSLIKQDTSKETQCMSDWG